jgi:hypothetical protein
MNRKMLWQGSLVVLGFRGCIMTGLDKAEMAPRGLQ